MRQQIEARYGLIDFTAYLYELFDLEYRFELSTRPENRLGTTEEWDFTGAALGPRSPRAHLRLNEATAPFTARRSICT